MANGFAFTSYDGADSDGVRAEVYVQRGKGKVTEVVPHSTGKSVNVKIMTEGLRYPNQGWVAPDSEIHKKATEALDSGKEINYRLESQRRSKVSRTTPLSELREDSKIAQSSVTSIVAEIDGVVSEEAVTNPAEDPQSGGRISARNQQPQDNQQSQGNPNNGQQNLSQRPNSRSSEEGSPWSVLNDDGSRNIGAARVQAASGIESFTRKHLIEAGWEESELENAVYGYSHALLSIVDALQSYFTKKQANRQKNSHTRIRATLFDTIENLLPFSLIREGKETNDTWYRKVGSTTQKRFTLVLELDAPEQHFDMNAFLGREEPKQDNSAQNSAEKGVSDEAAQSVRPKPRTEQEPASEAPTSRAPATDTSEDESNNISNIQKMVSSNDFAIMPPIEAPAYSGDVDLDKVEDFKNLLAEAEVSENEDISALLEYSFGQRNVKSISPDNMGNLEQFYAEHEIENPGNLKKVIAHIHEKKA